MSHRTLRRRLQELGTSYTQMVADLRLDCAQRALASGGVTIAEIAYQLGYTEPTNFRHAFRRWTGHSPSSFRASSLSVTNSLLAQHSENERDRVSA